MKYVGIVIGVVGAALFAWHLSRVLVGADQGQGPYTHHIPSLIGGVLMFGGIWLYVVGRRRGSRPPSGLPRGR